MTRCFAELKRWINAMPAPLQTLLTVKQERIEFNAAPTEMFISARTSRAEQPEALQGIHSEYVMLVADEASGVPEQVFEAAAGSMSGHNAVTFIVGQSGAEQRIFSTTRTQGWPANGQHSKWHAAIRHGCRRSTSTRWP